MSSNRFELKQAAIRLECGNAFLLGGLSRDDQVAHGPRLAAARRALAAEVEAEVAADWAGLGEAATIAMPERILNDYGARRRKSVLGTILAAAKQFRETVDRVVIVGSEADCASVRALFAAGCHPYHNEQGRGERGGRPRIYFAPSGYDNDAMQGLLDLLPHHRRPATVDDRWGIILIDSGGGALSVENTEVAEDAEKQAEQTAVAMRVLLAALRRAFGNDHQAAAESVLLCVSKWTANPDDLEAVSSRQVFTSEHAGPAAIFFAAGLLPASVMGLDIVRLLEGAAAMNERFRTAPIGANPPLDFGGIGELMRKRKGGFTPRFAGPSRGAAAAAEWCERLRAAEGGHLKSEISNLKSEILDFKSQIGDLQINIIAEAVRRDRITVESTGATTDPLSHLAGKSLPELSADTKAADIAAARPSVDFRLPALDEFSLGQLFQALIIATVLEARYNSA